jgi:hypothetical protein
MNKQISKVVGMVAVTAGLLGLGGAAHALPGTQAIPFPTAWNVWGPVVQSDGPFGNMVRGQTTKRHARDRYFYNTTSNRGSYFRTMDIVCSNGVFNATFPASNGAFAFLDSNDGDLTVICSQQGDGTFNSLVGGHVNILSSF